MLLKHSFEFPKSITTFSDFLLIENQKLYFIVNNQLVFYNIEKKEFESTNDSIPFASGSFSRLQKINNQFILLYDTYPYHPLDGLDKLELYIYDYKNDKIVEAGVFPFEGITFGNAIEKWVRVINEEIVVISPLSGKVVFYDSKLKERKHYKLRINGLESKINKDFFHEKDSIRITTNNNILKEHKSMVAKYGNNYFEKHINETKFLRDPYYFKEKISERLIELQNQHVYLEKIFAYNDEKMIVTFQRPEYKFEFQDLYIINISDGIIVDSIIKWTCEIPNEGIITRKEDYFPINLHSNRMNEPFLFNKNIYSSIEYPVKQFKEGTKKENDKTIFKWTKSITILLDKE